MNKNKTLIALVLDASGSMAPLQDVTIESVNSFIRDQLSQPGEVEFNIRIFNSGHVVIPNHVTLDKTIYNPTGGTALLDAIGFSIDSIGKDLASRKEDDRPGKIIFAIMTDGEENSSREYGGKLGRQKIFDKISHQKDKYSWNFTFLGANQDAIQAGQSLGISTLDCMTFNASNAGTKNVASAMSNYATRARTDSKFKGYTLEEAAASMQGDDLKKP